MQGNQALVAHGDDGDDGDAVPPFYGKVSLSEKTQWEGEQSSSSSPSSPFPVSGSEVEPLAWAKTSRYSQRADTGHRVSAAKNARATWIYSAWAPDVAPDLKYYDWPPAEFGGREHYPRGVAVPQRCAWLGDHTTPDAARAACQAHAAAAG